MSKKQLKAIDKTFVDAVAERTMATVEEVTSARASRAGIKDESWLLHIQIVNEGLRFLDRYAEGEEGVEAEPPAHRYKIIDHIVSTYDLDLLGHKSHLAMDRIQKESNESAIIKHCYVKAVKMYFDILHEGIQGDENFLESQGDNIVRELELLGEVDLDKARDYTSKSLLACFHRWEREL